MLAALTPQEQAEIEIFAAFLLARRRLQKPRLVTDDISVEELMTLVEVSGSFDWLVSEEEDVYSVEDGEPVQWVAP
jgi:hypothetical protein